MIFVDRSLNVLVFGIFAASFCICAESGSSLVVVDED